jgi:digeranylgeranylglycerophospholipid reductase
VGDSAGLVMPTNGGGIGQAIVSGKLAADSIISNIEDGVPLNSYEKKLKFVMQKPLKISLRSNKIFTKIMYNELLTEVSLRMLGPLGGIRRAMECKRPIWIL